MLEQGLDRISAGTRGAGDTSTGPRAGALQECLGSCLAGMTLGYDGGR